MKHLEVIKERSEQICSCEERILIVDDNQFNIMFLKNMIEKHYEVPIETALNG